MLEQLRLESYGCCCKMRVTTAVSILGWIGIIISSLIIIGGILLAVIPPIISPNSLILIIPGVVIILVWLLPLIVNSILIKRNRACSFGGVKSLIQIICKIFLSLELICSLILLFSMLTLLTLTALGYTVVSNNDPNNYQQLLNDADSYGDEACAAVFNQLEAARQGLGEPGTWNRDPSSTPNELPVDPAAVLKCLRDTAGPILFAVFITASVFAFIWIVFVCIAIHGIRKNRKGLLNAYIIFNIILLVAPIALEILSIFTNPYPAANVVFAIPGILVSIAVFLYHMGFFVVLYNMMDVSLDYAQEMKRI